MTIQVRRAKEIAAEYGPGTGPLNDFAESTRPIADDQLQVLAAATWSRWEQAVDADNKEMARELFRLSRYVEEEAKRRNIHIVY